MNNQGREVFIDLETGRRFVIEVIDNSNGNQQLWGDIDPATKTVNGNYGQKNKAGINEKDSIIKEENNFKNITTLGKGESPYSYINKLLKTKS